MAGKNGKEKKEQKPEVSISAVARKTRYLELAKKAGKSPGLSAAELKELEKMEKDFGGINFRACSQADVCRILNKGRDRIDRWASQGMPRIRDEKSGGWLYDPGKILTWRVERQKELDGIDGDMAGQASYWQEEYRKEKAREIKRKNDIQEGLLLYRADMESAHREIANAFRIQAEAIERVHGKKVGRDVRKMIDTVAAGFEKAYPQIYKSRKKREKGKQ